MPSAILIPLLSALLSGAISGYWFFGLGSDRTALLYEERLSAIRDEADEKLAVREQELLSLAKQRIASAIAAEKKRKPIEREIIKYVATNDNSHCPIGDDGLQLITRYYDATKDASH